MSIKISRRELPRFKRNENIYLVFLKLKKIPNVILNSDITIIVVSTKDHIKSHYLYINST